VDAAFLSYSDVRIQHPCKEGHNIFFDGMYNELKAIFFKKGRVVDALLVDGNTLDTAKANEDMAYRVHFWQLA
jgi:hypothetical protein